MTELQLLMALLIRLSSEPGDPSWSENIAKEYAEKITWVAEADKSTWLALCGVEANG